ncbi:isoprenoid synthase domain-containing protein [Cladorrhinum sp. PSN332]|nr:isoprenoid synthase domain-containing protein [Cladorrhinum sp. PSN332]
MADPKVSHDDTVTAETLDLADYIPDGELGNTFCKGFPLARHRHESLANAGSFEARSDWIKHIGPTQEFGNCNPIDGHFVALAWPLFKPDRLSLVSYTIEYGFLHDTVLEDVEQTLTNGDNFSFGQHEARKGGVELGRKQMQAKMMLKLNEADPAHAKRIIKEWKSQLGTTLRDKSKEFKTLGEYVEFRIVDSGAPFADALMCFGMDMLLTKCEEASVADIKKAIFASFGLVNDYFSFDREWSEAQQAGGPKPLNAVCLYMKWRSVGPQAAKDLVREASNRYLKALAYEASGNVVWSKTCPRYNPRFRLYDPNAGLEDALTTKYRQPITLPTDSYQEPESPRSPPSVTGLSGLEGYAADFRGISTSPSSVSGASGDDEQRGNDVGSWCPCDGTPTLNTEHLLAPVRYVDALPSKGVRDTLVDALNVWALLPENDIKSIKTIVSHLNTASLMLEDIQDNSEFRRGHPATHTVFGQAQTIHSRSFVIVQAMKWATDLGAFDIVNNCETLHIGQGYDLHWTRHVTCPSEKEYLEMVRLKTGGLFRLLSWIMSARAGLSDDINIKIDNLVQQLEIYFQIRDDYQNLNSLEYAAQNGSFEDLSEGQFSFPLVHLSHTSPDGLGPVIVKEIMRQRSEQGGLTLSQKELVVKYLKDFKSIEYTLGTLRGLEARIGKAVEELGQLTGKENWVLRLCLWKLKV